MVSVALPTRSSALLVFLCIVAISNLPQGLGRDVGILQGRQLLQSRECPNLDELLRVTQDALSLAIDEVARGGALATNVNTTTSKIGDAAAEAAITEPATSGVGAELFPNSLRLCVGTAIANSTVDAIVGSTISNAQTKAAASGVAMARFAASISNTIDAVNETATIDNLPLTETAIEVSKAVANASTPTITAILTTLQS